MRPFSVEGDLTLIPKQSRAFAECLVLDHFTPHERHLADLVGGYFAVHADGFGEHHLGRVRITVELLQVQEAGACGHTTPLFEREEG
jgi:hypothetical protein